VGRPTGGQGEGKMKIVNEAVWDRVLRVTIGVIMLWLGWMGVVTGGWGEVLKYAGFLPLLTGLAGFCPFYALARIRTNRV
jgi:hypothetical protein